MSLAYTGFVEIDRLEAIVASPVDEGHVLDLAALADLRALQEEGEPDLVCELAHFYLEHTPAVLSQLCAAATAGDGAVVAQLAHDLKGSSGNFGAARLVGACRRLEQEARAGRTGELALSAADVYVEHRRLCRDLEWLCAA